MKRLGLCAVVAIGMLAGAADLPQGVLFAEDGAFRMGQTQVGVRIVPSEGWRAQYRNGAFRILRREATAARRTLLAELPQAGGLAEQEIAAQPDGSAAFSFTASFTNHPAFLAAFIEIRMSTQLKGIEVDGRPVAFPAEAGGAGLGSFPRVGSFSVMALDGTKTTFTGSFPLTLQDSRVFGETWFEARIPLQRREGADGGVSLTRAFSFSCVKAAANGLSFFQWGKGLPVYTNTVFHEGPEWVKVDFARTTMPGSPLDFSFLQDAPAGKHGFLTRGADGRAAFTGKPGMRPRFYGGNFAWDASLLDKDVSARVAAEMPRLGYNLVRAHQHDTKFLPKGAADSAALDPAALDRWDWFVYCMKSNGVYFTTDCYSSRAFLPTDAGLASYAGPLRAMKEALFETPAALANWKLFTRRLLTHVNPYTGLALVDDPALVCLNLVNEENVPDAKRQMEIHREQLRFLREDLKVKCLLTSLNYESQPDLVVRRSLFDVADLHMYFSHPNSDGKRNWYSGVFASQLTGRWPGGIWGKQFPSRIWGMPVLTTEFRHCWPNVFRCEAGPMIGAYGAFQDWDALVGYGYAEGAASLGARNFNANPFDTCNDPFALFGEKISILMFRRGDVRPARHKVCVTVPRTLVDLPPVKRPHAFPDPVCSLGLLTGVGSAVERAPEGMDQVLSLAGAAAPKGLAGDFLKTAANGVWRGDTGETVLDTRAQTLLVSTPRTESCTLAEGALAGAFLRVSDIRHPTTVSAHALDGKPLAESRSVLVFHLTDSANDGESFTDLTMRHPVARGKGPMLVRRDTARVAFPAGFTVTALRCDGSAAGMLAPDADGAFTLRTDAYPGAVLAYHLTRAE